MHSLASSVMFVQVPGLSLTFHMFLLVLSWHFDSFWLRLLSLVLTASIIILVSVYYSEGYLKWLPRTSMKKTKPWVTQPCTPNPPSLPPYLCAWFFSLCAASYSLPLNPNQTNILDLYNPWFSLKLPPETGVWSWFAQYSECLSYLLSKLVSPTSSKPNTLPAKPHGGEHSRWILIILSRCLFAFLSTFIPFVNLCIHFALQNTMWW